MHPLLSGRNLRHSIRPTLQEPSVLLSVRLSSSFLFLFISKDSISDTCPSVFFVRPSICRLLLINRVHVGHMSVCPSVCLVVVINRVHVGHMQRLLLLLRRQPMEEPPTLHDRRYHEREKAPPTNGVALGGGFAWHYPSLRAI